MQYLHRSAFKSHGNLTSAVCLIDNRWVLKISGFGLHPFKDDFDVSQMSVVARCHSFEPQSATQSSIYRLHECWSIFYTLDRSVLCELLYRAHRNNVNVS
jgi:hypothetical protein